tara:strand:- start:567 stop:917 length:351 start_codon:yes stop_codon:yes gene_type:complete
MLSPYVMPGIQEGTDTINFVFMSACYSTIEKETSVTKEQILSKVRKRPYVDAKKVIAIALRKHTKIKVIDIGIEFNVDHSTISHYIKVFDSLYNHDSAFRELYDRLTYSLIEKQLI